MKKRIFLTLLTIFLIGGFAFSQAVPPQTVEFIDNVTFTEDSTSASKDVGNIHQILLFLTITADPVSYTNETLEVIIETQDPDGVWHTKQSFIKIESDLTVPYYEYIILDSFGSKLRINVKVTGAAPSYAISVKGYGKYGGGGSGGGSGGAPASAHYLTDQAEVGLSAEVVVTANGKALVTAANYAAMKALLDLEIGTDVPALAHTMASHSDDDTYNISTSGSAAVTKGFFHGAITTATPSGAFTIDWTAKQVHQVTITGANLDITFTNPSAPCRLWLVVIQGDGDDTIDWTHEADILWPGAVDPVLSTGSGDIDIVSFIWDGTRYLGVANYDFD